VKEIKIQEHFVSINFFIFGRSVHALFAFSNLFLQQDYTPISIWISMQQGYQIWPQSGSDLPQMGQNWDFLR